MEEEEALQPRGARVESRRGTRNLTPKIMHDLLMESPEKILMRLASDGGGLYELVRKQAISDQAIACFLALVHKSFTPQRLQFNSAQIRGIVDIVLKTDFLNFTLYQFLAGDGPKRAWQDQHLDLAIGALALVDFVMAVSPQFAYPKVFQLPAVLREKLREVQDPIIAARLDNFEQMILQRQQHQQQRLHQQQNQHTNSGGRARGRSGGTRLNADDDQVEETFRALPLVPTNRDLTAEEHMFVRRNRDTGRYHDLEHYLDVQFRLLRADLIIPLRETIDKYLGAHEATNPRERVGRVRVYRDVQIVRPVCTDKYISYRLSFDIGVLSSVDWKTTQRFKFGCLLCLSDDNFQTFLCAVVNDRDTDLLANGLVDVVFVLDRHELNRVTDVSRDRRFVMVESPAYFEAYRHVLQGLKNLHDHNFPFIPYIVECQKTVNAPWYLQRTGEDNVKYDFRPLLKENFVVKDTNEDLATDLLGEAELGVGGLNAEELALNVEAGGVEVMSGKSWPTKDDLRLDETQYKALFNALTREFAVVQGPPGTGKTYLGLKIIKMLLHNSSAWNDPRQKRPLLVVCYTNHALDQFLEGVLDFFHGSLIRVGTRSNSERLKERTLQHFRTRAKANRNIPVETHEAKLRARRELQTLRLDIHEKAAMVEIVEQEIVKESFLKDFIESAALNDFQKSLGKNKEGSPILKWLMLELLHERLKYQAEHRMNRLPTFQEFRLNNPSASAPVPVDFQDDIQDDDDDEIVDFCIRDSTQTRKLDADEDEDDDELYYLDEDDIDLDREESESEKLRRRQREIHEEMRRIRGENVELDLSGFCEVMDQRDVRDRTGGRASKVRDKEVAETLKKLTMQWKRTLQARLRSVDKMAQDEAEQAQKSNIWKLKVTDRWRLYRYWTDLFCRQLRGDIRQQEETYFDLATKYREILYEEDRSVLEKATVVGMTTTAAARYQSILHAIGPPVIMVEEAAEVFEAHVVATLSRQCQHLILIGDHKQLRPTTTVHHLARQGKLDVSLFERMVKNDFPFDCLGYQHRMCPDISRMMTLPQLYPKLRDHEEVMSRPPVKGVRHNVYYISHSHAEHKEEETKSFSNTHEAAYLVALCAYLLKQGYLPHQITILATYSNQARALSSRMPRREFEGVRVSSVDNYQGEENDIILLSLVRSNTDNDVGFVKTDNRIAVALSRAKIGMYVIGNFEVLQNSSNELWRQIVERARAQGILGGSLPLACQNHPKEAGIMATTADDFKKAPEGGCQRPCNVRLACGHQCLQTCHPGNTGHAQVTCRMPCSRQCASCGTRCDGRDHVCCHHQRCSAVTEKVIPRCGHAQLVPCGQDPMLIDCSQPCELSLGCGHKCQSTCGSPCTRQCQEEVEVESPQCGHKTVVKCGERAAVLCSKPCRAQLVCGHTCRGTCGECSRGRLHVQCQEKCRKILVCGHNCPASCCQCPPCAKPCQNRCVHSYCDRLCGEECVPCAMKCEWQCPHQSCSKLCGEQCDRERCDHPCPKTLPDCGHPCMGLCGETCPIYCRICDQDLLDDVVSGELEEGEQFVLLEDCCHVVEVTYLDKWIAVSREFQMTEEEEEQGVSEGGIMKSEDNNTAIKYAGACMDSSVDAPSSQARNKSRAIKFPECPQCKTPIRRNFRYGNLIKKALEEMEAIKKRCRGNETRVDVLQKKVEQARNRVPAQLRPQVGTLFIQSEVLCESRLATQFYQITLVTDVNKLLTQVSNAMRQWPDMQETFGIAQQDLQHLQTWILKPRSALSTQELFDVRQEFQRLKILVHLLHCRQAISSGNIKEEVSPRLVRSLAASIRQLMAGTTVAENLLDEGRQLQEELKDVVVDPFAALTDEEREEIVKAVSLPVGSWYACPKGHYYVIGDCGRPMEVAQCPECHSEIGGENHALREDNRQAPEFDNATGPRWSEEDDFEMAFRLQQEEYDNWG